MALDNFILGTVFEPTFIKLKKDSNGDWIEDDLQFTLDTIKITNLTQEGPEKTARGGLNNRIIARHGKTGRLEIEDAMGDVNALNYLQGAKTKIKKSGTDHSYSESIDTFKIEVKKGAKSILLPHKIVTELDNSILVPDSNHSFSISDGTTPVGNYIISEDGRYVILNETVQVDTVFEVKYKVAVGSHIAVGDSFPSYFKVVGTTFGIKRDGTKQYMKFTIHRFLPDGLLNLTLEAEGDFGVMEIGGEIFPNKCGDFYTIEGATSPTNCD